jgi:transposase InsO family protein
MVVYNNRTVSRRHCTAGPEQPSRAQGISVDRPNQAWAMDITYIPMAKGFVYLAAVVDWFSRRVLSWRVSIQGNAIQSS